MLILLPLLRRLGVRTRMTVGTLLTGAGVVLIAIAVAAASGLLIQGIIAAAVGVIFLAHGARERRRVRLVR
jgi:hypothetical protein